MEATLNEFIDVKGVMSLFIANTWTPLTLLLFLYSFVSIVTLYLSF